MRRLLVLAVLLVLLAGCQREPPLAGGKPLEFWVQAAGDGDARTRRSAVRKLGNAGTPEACAALTAALRDRDAEVRREAIVALMKCGRPAQDALPVLAELRQRDPDGRVRAHAARAVEKLERDAAVR